jgi:hypothetical protein
MNMSKVEVEVIAENGLSGEIWKFHVHSEREMKAIYYARVSRSSKRHKWVEKAHWNRYSDRTATIKTSELVLTHEVMAQAKQNYIETLERNLVVSIPD